MRYKYLNYAMTVLLCSVVISYGKTENRFDELMRLNEEIRILNLVNGLELTPDQATFIIQKAETAQKLKDEALRVFEEREQDAAYAFNALNKLKGVLTRNQNIEDNLRKKVHTVEKELRTLKDEYEAKVAQLAEEVKGVLESHQLYALDKYVPCLIPPPGERRIGQARDGAGIKRQLRRIREMPDRAYRRRRTEIADIAFEHIKRHLPKGYRIDEKKEKARLLSVLDEARALSGVDFELKKDELAEKLEWEHVLPRLPLDLAVKVEKFLLNPAVIPILKDR